MNYLLNFKSFFNFLSRNKGYTAINVFGLSVSLMFVILIAVYTSQEMSVDKLQRNSEQIYLLASESTPNTALSIGYRLKERYPEIEKVCPMVLSNIPDFQVFYEDKKIMAKSACVDSAFFDFFSFELLNGDPLNVLKESYSAVISETFAHKLFAGENPIGKRVRISDSTFVMVTGVMNDIQNSVIPYKDIFVRLERAADYNQSISLSSDGNAGSSVAFIKAHEGADLLSKAPDILSYFKESFWLYQGEYCKEVQLIPFDEIYFHEFEYSSLLHGDRRFVLLLVSVGLLILIFAVFNYINLTVAQSGQRAKEMATRRLLGSSRTELIIRLILETTLLTFCSFMIGLFLSYVSLPFANQLLDTKLQLSIIYSPAWTAIAFGIILLIGILSGLLPAILISSVKPIDVVRGSFRRQTKMVFSKCFITFQNTITIATLTAALVMGVQIYYMVTAPLGYNRENILVVDNSCRSRSELTAIQDQLRTIPELKAIGFTCGTPFNGGNNLSGVYEGKSLSFQQLTMDSVSFNMLGLHISKDNHVASRDKWSWYLTERALKDLDLPETAETFTLEGHGAIPILGIISDFHLRIITLENSPVMLNFSDFKERWPWQFLIKVEGDPFVAYDKVKQVMENVTGADFDGEYLNQQIQNQYESQIRMVKIIAVFAIIAILISLLGLLAMSTYFIQQRSQEIAIRKVFGSDNQNILIRLVSSFLVYVIIAFVISAPVCWFIMKQWLSGYSYRITLNPLYFLAAGIFCFLISFLAVFFQSWRAANVNPVNSVKSS